MKISRTLFIALSLASSSTLAQVQQPSAQPATPLPGAQAPQESQGWPVRDVMRQDTQAPEAQSSGSQGADTQSSGEESAGAQSAMEASSGGGQLITESIVNSKVTVPSAQITLQPQTENGITYVCGGIGEAEANYMKQTAARDYDLMMTFAARSGSYVADVDVAIKDARGNEVLNANCGGPIMLVDFPRAGTYRVQAEAAGHTINRTVRVGARSRGTNVVFAWPREALGSPGMAESRRDRENRESAGSDDATGESGRNGGSRSDRDMQEAD